jgi:membrane-associated phospholipid phosphatase
MARFLALGLGLSFVVLAILVGVGSLAGVDQWSVQHLMLGLAPGSASPSMLHSLFPIFDPGRERGHLALTALTYAIVWTASIIPSALLVLSAIVYLWRRAHGQLAVGLGVAFVAVNVVEVIGKASISRPALFAHTGQSRIHVRSFDGSFPSGHEIRAVLLAVCLVACFRKLWPLGLTWLGAVTVMLVVGGWHTPSDVAGGLLVSASVCVACISLVGSDRFRRPLDILQGFAKAGRP